jgi:hypothetical protein
MTDKQLITLAAATLLAAQRVYTDYRRSEQIRQAVEDAKELHRLVEGTGAA